jgi:uncharacterized protein YjiS (DUF1127 family)/mannose-6-phosphate isomerase-like protein (cupin superfamily)
VIRRATDATLPPYTAKPWQSAQRGVVPPQHDLEEMMFVLNNRYGDTSPLTFDWLARIASTIARFLSRGRRVRHVRLMSAEPRTLDDRMLTDIGLQRYQIETAALKGGRAEWYTPLADTGWAAPAPLTHRTVPARNLTEGTTTMTSDIHVAGPVDQGERMQTRPRERCLLRVAAAETKGAWSAVEILSHPGESTPMHVHQNEDEHFLVLGGTAHVARVDETFDAPISTAITRPAVVIAGLLSYSCQPERTAGKSFDSSRRGASVAEAHHKTADDSRQGIAVRPVGRPMAGSSLVRRLVLAKADPAKQRIRAWLSDIDDERLFCLGLTSEDIAALRGTASRPAEATIAQGLDAPSEDSGVPRTWRPIAGCSGRFATSGARYAAERTLVPHTDWGEVSCNSNSELNARSLQCSSPEVPKQ